MRRRRDSKPAGAIQQVRIEGNTVTVAQALKHARLHSQQTQWQLAIEIDVDYASVSRWENARYVPSLAAWLDALNACGYEVCILRKEKKA